MSCHFTKTFVHLSIIAVVSNFNVFKLIESDPANTYLFKFNNKNPRKRCEICSKLTINTVKRRCGDLIVNFEHISHLFLVLPLFTMNRQMFDEDFFLCKYHYPKYKDKQMLYLTSFNRVADFLNNLNFLDISLQVHIQLTFPEKKFYFSSYLAETGNIVN